MRISDWSSDVCSSDRAWTRRIRRTRIFRARDTAIAATLQRQGRDGRHPGPPCLCPPAFARHRRSPLHANDCSVVRHDGARPRARFKEPSRNARRAPDDLPQPFARPGRAYDPAMSAGTRDPSDERLYRWRFGAVEFDEARHELRVAGLPVEIEHRPPQVLALLLRHVGAVVTKEALFDAALARAEER